MTSDLNAGGRPMVAFKHAGLLIHQGRLCGSFRRPGAPVFLSVSTSVWRWKS
jgi:hypothetical protein